MARFWRRLFHAMIKFVVEVLLATHPVRHFEAVGQVKAFACQNGHAAVGPACSEAQCFIQKFKAQKFLLHSPAMG